MPEITGFQQFNKNIRKSLKSANRELSNIEIVQEPDHHDKL